LSTNSAALQIVSRGFAVAQEVGHLTRLVPVVRQDEQNGLALIALVFELRLDLLPPLDAGDQQVAVLLPGVWLAIADVWLDRAGFLVANFHPLQHWPLDDAVTNCVG
jgi:hypothetical protein